MERREIARGEDEPLFSVGKLNMVEGIVEIAAEFSGCDGDYDAYYNGSGNDVGPWIETVGNPVIAER
ncbi:MAG: hypothetical protein JWL77_3167 [Chthonomonadaceae bacterium]|nr:hypothetical protein [Chthonomonadaceae bacterium]